MRLGVAPSGRRSAADAVHLARRAEDAGLDEVWVSEDYTERGAFAVAGAIAAVTDRVRVGLGVINPWTRHVVLTAMETQALAEISAGRAIVGLGASNESWMTGRLGIRFEKPVSTLAQYTAILRRLLAGEHVTETLFGHDVDTALDAAVTVDVPVVWGVKGPRALELARTAADGAMLSVLSSPAYVAWVRESFRPASITAYASFAVGDSRSAARDRLRAHTARFLGIHGASAITREAGIGPEVADRLRAALLSGESAEHLVDDDMIGRVTVSGTTDDAAAALTAHRDAGVDSLVVIDDGSADPHDLVDGLVAAARTAGIL